MLPGAPQAKIEAAASMENIAVNMASILPGPVGAAIEDMLGRALQDDEQVSAIAFRPHAAPTGAAQQPAGLALRMRWTPLPRKRFSGDPQDLEDAFDEAMLHVRPGRA
jgi:hypothetical protein